MKCPNCGFNPAEDAVYCSNCGSVIETESSDVQGIFVCIVVSIIRSSFFDEHSSITGQKATDAVGKALERCVTIARRHNAESTKTSADSVAILYPIETNKPTNVDDAISFVTSLRNELLDWFAISGEDLTLGIGVDIGKITYQDFILTVSTGKYSPLNNATRLVQKAAPNAILISDTVAGLVSGRHALKPVGFYQLHGEDALKIYEISPSDVKPFVGFPRQKIETIGFSGEIETVMRILNTAATDGKATSLSVTGEPGSGKTEFVNHILDELSGDRWFTARLFACKEAELEPYFLLRQLTDQLPNYVASIADKTGINLVAAELTKYALGQPADFDYSELLHYRPLGGLLEKALTEAIAELGATQPILIIIDDFDFADSASASYLAEITSTLNDIPLAIITVSCPTESSDNIFPTALPLPELDDETAAIIQGSFNWRTEPGEGLIQHCVDISAGAFGRFVTTLRFLDENQTIIGSGDISETPRDIEGIIVDRFNRLSETDKSIIELLEAVKIPLSLEEILSYPGATANPEALQTEETLANLVDTGFINKLELAGGGKYQIRVSLPLRSDLIDKSDSQFDYREALTFYEKNDYPYNTLKAHIASLSGKPEIAARALLASARRAHLYGIPYDAIILLTSALELKKNDDLTNDLLFELYSIRGDIYESERVFSGAKQDFESALKLTEPYTDQYIRLSLKRCKLFIDNGQLDKASECLNAGEAAIDSEKLAETPYVYEIRGDLYRSTNKPAAAKSNYEKALSLNRDTYTKLGLLKKSGIVRLAIGDINGAIYQNNEALELAEKEGNPKMEADAALELSKSLPYRLDFDRAVYLVRHALDWYESVADYRAQALSYLSLANLGLFTANSEMFFEYTERGKRLLEKAPDNDLTAWLFWMKAYFDMTMGDEAGFIENTSQRSLKINRLEGLAADIAVYLLISNFEANIKGNFAEALKAAKKAKLLLANCSNWNYRAYTDLALATALRGLGKKDEALSILLKDKLRDLAMSNALFQIDYFMILGLLLAETGDKEEGIRKVRLAASIAKDGGIRFLEARCYIELASILSGEESYDVLDRAVWLFTTIGNDFWRERAESLAAIIQ